MKITLAMSVDTVGGDHEAELYFFFSLSLVGLKNIIEKF